MIVQALASPGTGASRAFSFSEQRLLDASLDWIGLDCVGLDWIGLSWAGSQFNFFLIPPFFLNAKDYHEQQNNLKQDRRSVAGGFKRAARHFHVVVEIRGMVHGLHVAWIDWSDSHSIFSFIFSILIVALFVCFKLA